MQRLRLTRQCRLLVVDAEETGITCGDHRRPRCASSVAMEIVRHSQIATTMEVYSEVRTAKTGNLKRLGRQLVGYHVVLCCCPETGKVDPVIGIGL